MKKDIENHYLGKYGYENYDMPPDGGCFGSCVAALIAIILCGLITLLTGCHRVEYVTQEVPVYLHDTLTSVRLRADTLIQRDSVYFEIVQVGDTIYKNKYVEKWKTRVEVRHDTLVQVAELPVETEKTVVVEVKRPLSKWQKAMIALGVAALVAVLLSLLYYLYTRTRANGLTEWLKKLIRRT